MFLVLFVILVSELGILGELAWIFGVFHELVAVRGDCLPAEWIRDIANRVIEPQIAGIGISMWL